MITYYLLNWREFDDDKDFYNKIEELRIIYKDETQIFYKFGKIHRENNPAIIYKDGNTEFWLNDKQTVIFKEEGNDGKKRKNDF